MCSDGFNVSLNICQHRPYADLLTLSVPIDILSYKVKDHITSFFSYGTLRDRDSGVTHKL